MKRKNSNPKPKRHSQRVAAWVYTVLNPIVGGLEREIHFLDQGNLTWRCYARRCEYIRPVQEYVQSGHWPNYRDFLADNRNFAREFATHDSVVCEAESLASKFYDLLMQSALFGREVSAYLEEYEAALDTAASQQHSLEHMKGELPKYVAEYLINEVKVLPAHYTAHKFWEKYSVKFRDVRFWERYAAEFEPYKDRQSFKLLSSAKQRLADFSRRLKRRLEDHRLFLCRKFDVPAAPIELPVHVGSAF